MRKLKNRKEKKDLRAILETVHDNSLQELEKILNDDNAFAMVMFFYKKQDKEFAKYIAEILCDVTKCSLLKNGIKKIQTGFLIKQKAMSIIKKFSLKLKPDENMLAFTALFELNELLCGYTQYENRMIKALNKSCEKNDCPEFREHIRTITRAILKETAVEYLGYEPMFLGVTERKLLDVLNWLPKSLDRMIKYTPLYFSPEAIEEAMENIYSSIKENLKLDELFSKEIIERHGKECELFYSFIIRTSLADRSIEKLEELYKGVYPLKYKSDIRYLKNTITRLKTVLNRLYQLIEYGEVREE